jgi:hypothetical protein
MYTMPDTLAAGRVTLVMRNTGQEPHHAQLLRLNDGVTLDQFMSALAQGEGPALALVSAEGGPGAAMPNGQSQVTLDLKDGTYVTICFIPSPDGIPHLAKGMVKPLQVTTPPAPSGPEPAAAATLTMKDFSFEMPATLPAGRQTYRIVSEGPSQIHELIFARPQPGQTVQTIQQYFAGGESGPPPYTVLGGMQAMNPNRVGWTTVDLTPGEYVAICVVPDPASGKPHVDLGMIHGFTVR